MCQAVLYHKAIFEFSKDVIRFFSENQSVDCETRIISSKSNKNLQGTI